MEEKYNLNNMIKAFEKLFNAGFNTSKKIATLDIKEVRKIPNLTEFLSGYKEKGN